MFISQSQHNVGRLYL